MLAPAIDRRTRRLSRHYSATLERYLARQREELLQRAYEIGRQAIACGLGVLDMGRMHQRALAARASSKSIKEKRAAALKAAETFFLEALSPFEAAHRGFREANLRLQALTAALEGRNTALGNEVAQSRRSESALRQLSNRILHAQEEERKRISRELHDAVGGSLAGISVNLALLHKADGLHGRAAGKQIADTQRVVQEAMETVHNFAHELRPAALDDLGLVPALRSYLNKFAGRTRLQVDFRASPEAERLNSEQKTVIFRVTQESLTNVAKHARASRVRVTLRKQKHGVRVEIRDNGQAFRVDKQLGANGRERLGLLGMQERVRLVNGRLAIKSLPSEGTIVSAEIPFPTAGPGG
jgi:signal transduction histidine kinase